MSTSKNPIIHYLKTREWRWLSEQEICDAAKCTPNEIQALFTNMNYKQYVEQRNGKYRYISTNTEEKRRMVEYLKRVYPSSVGAAELIKHSNAGITAPQTLARYSDVLPVEIIMEGGKRRYRYVPDDERSLMNRDPVKTMAEWREPKHASAIIHVLKKFRKDYLSSREIADRVGGGVSSRSVGASMNRISKKYPVHAKINSQGTTVYRYMEA